MCSSHTCAIDPILSKGHVLPAGDAVTNDQVVLRESWQCQEMLPGLGAGQQHVCVERVRVGK